MVHLIHDCNLTLVPRLSVRTYSPVHNLSKHQQQICTRILYCDITDLLVIPTSNGVAPTATNNTRHGTELRPHTTEEIVTLELGHAPCGLVWSRTNLIIPRCSDSLGGHGSGGSGVGRASIIIIVCSSGTWSIAAVGLGPALISALNTEVIVGQDMDGIGYRQEIELKDHIWPDPRAQ